MIIVTSARDGKCKVWVGPTMQYDNMTIAVTDGSWVTCIQYMKGPQKRLVAASANRMISFYDLSSTNYNVPTSRIEGLVGIPLCMEYYKWPENNNKDGKKETLLVGDDLGIIHMYNFTHPDWHTCQYRVEYEHKKNQKKGSRDINECHKRLIEDAF